MNIAVYVTSNYSNYDRLSKMLSSYIRKYTTSPVLITALSPSTKPNHGNLLVKRYADENRIRCKVYETEWNKWKKSAGSIASYHMNHNSERSIVFWDGLSRGCKNYLMMTQRLNRPCDLIRVNPNDGVEVAPKNPALKEPLPTTNTHPSNGVVPATPQGNEHQRGVQSHPFATEPSAPHASASPSTAIPQSSSAAQSSAHANTQQSQSEQPSNARPSPNANGENNANEPNMQTDNSQSATVQSQQTRNVQQQPPQSFSAQPQQGQSTAKPNVQQSQSQNADGNSEGNDSNIAKETPPSSKNSDIGSNIIPESEYTIEQISGTASNDTENG